MGWMISAGVALVVIVVGVFWWLKRRGGDLVSVVVLRSAKGTLTEPAVRAAYRRAYSQEPQIQKIDIEPGTSGFIATSDDLPPMFVIGAGKPYMPAEEAERCAQGAEHPAVRSAINGHSGWISVDAAGALRGLKKTDLKVI